MSVQVTINGQVLKASNVAYTIERDPAVELDPWFPVPPIERRTFKVAVTDEAVTYVRSLFSPRKMTVNLPDEAMQLFRYIRPGTEHFVELGGKKSGPWVLTRRAWKRRKIYLTEVQS